MNHHQDIVQGGWWYAASGIVMSIWNWFTAGMNGATLMLTLLTALLTVIKIADAVRRWNSTSGPIAQRLRDAVTRPGDLDVR